MSLTSTSVTVRKRALHIASSRCKNFQLFNTKKENHVVKGLSSDSVSSYSNCSMEYHHSSSQSTTKHQDNDHVSISHRPFTRFTNNCLSNINNNIEDKAGFRHISSNAMESSENGNSSTDDESDSLMSDTNLTNDVSLLSLLEKSSSVSTDSGYGEKDDEIGHEDHQSITSNTTRGDNMNSSKKRRIRKKKQEQRRQKQSLKSLLEKSPTKASDSTAPAVPMQTRRNAELLFDSLAPHLEMDTVILLKSQLVKLKKFITHHKTSTTNKKKPKNKKRVSANEYVIQVVAEIHRIFNESKNSKNKRKNTSESKDSLLMSENPWIQSLLLQYFIGKASNDEADNQEVDKGVFQHSSKNAITIAPPVSQSMVYGDPSFTPNANRATFKRNVSILMKAREVSIASSSPLLWSNKHKLRLQKQVEENSSEHQNYLDEKIDVHCSKSSGSLQYEAEMMASILADRLPRKLHDNLIAFFEEYTNQALLSSSSEDEKVVSLPDSKKNDSSTLSSKNDASNENNKMDMLYVNLEQCTKTHIHLIATDVAKFFYVDIPEEVQHAMGGAAAAAVIATTPNSSSHLPTTTDLHDFSHSPDPRLNEAWKEWNQIRDDLVDVLLTSQQEFSSIHQSKIREDDSVFTTRQNTDDLKGQQQIKTKDEEKKDIVETLQELDFLRTSLETGKLAGRDRNLSNRKTGRRSKGVHVKFSATLLNNKFGPYSQQSTAAAADEDKSLASTVSEDLQLPETDRIIFIDNLPIDITKEEIHDLYSRCGPIESVEIFNLRPELDPGKLSGSKQLERRKKKRKSVGSMADFRKLGGRERTPIYGAIKFRSSAGYKTATMDQLRIFGMVVRFHPIRTIRARDVTSLFLEGIPSGYASIDIEHKISKLMYPDIYACVDLGQNDYAELKSCEIKFPTFEVANHAYRLLQDVDLGNEEFALNWMRTRENAMSYWTRELGFDP